MITKSKIQCCLDWPSSTNIARKRCFLVCSASKKMARLGSSLCLKRKHENWLGKCSFIHHWENMTWLALMLHFFSFYRKIYNISIFFFYFHTIIMGVAGVLARTCTSLFLGIFFLSRTDRNLMIQGFHNSDRGYASYLGYLHVVATHRNPVRVIFCQILVDLLHKQHVVVKKGIFLCLIWNKMLYSSSMLS